MEKGKIDLEENDRRKKATYAMCPYMQQNCYMTQGMYVDPINCQNDYLDGRDIDDDANDFDEDDTYCDNGEMSRDSRRRRFYPYGYGFGYPGYGYKWGHHGWYRDNEDNQRHENSPQPIPIQPLLQPTEKNYTEFKSLEKDVNITQINNIVIEMKNKHPYMMEKLLMLGLVEEECKKIIYLVLLCSGKFDL